MNGALPDYHKATNAAYKLLLECGFDSFPIDPFKLNRFFPNVRVEAYSDLCWQNGLLINDFVANAYSEVGFLKRQIKNGVTKHLIAYNDTISEAIYRFTLLHEYGHIVLEHKHLDDLYENRETDCFARNFLCPLPARVEWGLDDIDTIARIFNMSYSASLVAVDKRGVDRGNIKKPLYDQVVKQFRLGSITAQQQLTKYDAKLIQAREAFASISPPRCCVFCGALAPEIENSICLSCARKYGMKCANSYSAIALRNN